MASAAAAPDHTVVLLQASCPPLPHGASAAISGVNPSGSDLQVKNRSSSFALEQDSDVGRGLYSDFGDGDGEDEEDEKRKDNDDTTPPGRLIATNSDGFSEPLSLKQHCEVALAREVDLRNATSWLAYADAMNSPALFKYCADFVSSNFDGILVLGRESDRCSLLETTDELVC